MSFLALFLLICAFGLGCKKKPIDGAYHHVLWENPKSLDPAQCSEANVGEALGPVYEPLFQYHYLKRPYQLIPLLAESMPVYSKDGLTVTIKIKKGVRYQDDAAFAGGKGREITVNDFIFAFKRLADTKVLSDGWWTLDGKVVGLNEWRDENSKLPVSDYSKAVGGLTAVDPYTLVIKLKKKYPQLNYVLAMIYTAPVPQEAIVKYGLDFAMHPVGTGPFVLKEFVRSSNLTYEKNPNFREEYFPQSEGQKEIDGVDVSDFDYGKRLPLIDKMVIHIILEKQPIWLKLVSGQLDWARVFKDNFKDALTADNKLAPELYKKGIRLQRIETSTFWWISFNMTDPVIGGEKNKLIRKAMSLAYDVKKDIELFIGGQASPANQMLAPVLQGYNAKLSPKEYNIEKAKELLVKAGYPGAKGIPTMAIDTEGSSEQRQIGEFFKAQMALIGINIEIKTHSRPELFDVRKKGKSQIHRSGWGMDYPDAENYIQLLYGPNKSPGPNDSNFQNPEFDKLYEQMSGMEPSPARQKIIDRMTEIWLEESPWIPVRYDMYNLVYPAWVKNYLYVDINYTYNRYYRIDLEKKKELLKNF